MSLFAVVMLVAAFALLAAAEWPRVSRRFGRDERQTRDRRRRKAKLEVIEGDSDEDFIRAVERDLASLPTIDEQDVKR